MGMVRRTASTKKVGKKERPCFERYHGFLPGGGGAMKDTMSLYQRVGGGYERYHGSLRGGGGAMKDTMSLCQGRVGL